ncbi:MAG: VTT domain-containing protein [Bacilli bacterium]|nr:VTT domain-containing protein [Bacilli bacterium]MDD4733899.1 VTT domain-containing protein [Bacilli bacterium]
MQETLEQIVLFLKNIIVNDNIIISILMGLIIVIVESILPILPLAVFIAINTLVMGNALGFVVSWIGTVIGCAISFWLFRKGLSKRLYKNLNSTKYSDLMKKMSSVKFSLLVIVTALPFTPAFTINIAAGLSKMSFKKFILAMLIAKISIIFFWGYIGTTLIESISDYKVLIKIVILLLGAYIVSYFVNKKYNLD